MHITIEPGVIKGVVHAPASKSVMQRACAAALLRNGCTVIKNYGRSDDDNAALNIIQQLGAGVRLIDEDTLEIRSSGWPGTQGDAVIHCGESGLSLRMFTFIAALSKQKITIGGKGSLLTRPVHFFETILPQLNVTVAASDNKLPLHMKGPLRPADIRIDGSITSQVLTGLLMSYSVAAGRDVTIAVTDLKSKPYIDLTLKVMQDFGMNTPVNHQYECFSFRPKPQDNAAFPTLTYTVEGDWSNAAFYMVAAAIAGSITIKGLDVFTEQADKKVLEALQDCGCRLSIHTESVAVVKHHLKAFHFDATDCPDLFPPLVALAANCAGTSVIAGVHRLAHKESDRAMALQKEFRKLGVQIRIQDDKMIIAKEVEPETPAVLDSHNDHRIVMACAIAALAAKAPVTIHGIEAVDKSYPDFFKHLELLTS